MKYFCFLFLLAFSMQQSAFSSSCVLASASKNTIWHLQKSTNKKSETVVIQTSAQCGTCKTTIEKALKKTKGVKKATLDLDTQKVMVKYNPKKITPNQIRKAINNAGYDADQLPANPAAYNALPACCKKGGHE